MHPFKITLLPLALLLVSTACTKHYPKPSDALQESSEVIQAVRASHAELQTLRMKDMRMDYYGDEGRVSIRQLILIQHPDRLRMQTYIPGLDGVAGVLACGCGSFAFHDRRENVYYYGPATAENVARILPVGLSCADLNHLMIGSLPFERIRNEAGEPTLSWDTETGRYAMTWPLQRGPHRGGVVEAQVTHKTWKVTSLFVKNKSGKKVFEYEVNSLESFKGHMLPTRRRFRTAKDKDDISLKGDNIQINPELDEILFTLEAPQGTELRYVGDDLNPPPPPSEGVLCTE